ncbi:MAG: ATP-binding cassette domain-containing protein [Candidatus Adiutrix sp.]
MTIEIDLKFKYETGPSLGGALFSFDLRLPGEGITGVVGPSGAGKTTFLRCLAGLNRAEGRVVVQGHLWQDKIFFLPTHKRPLGYVFQEGSLFPHLTVAQNINYGVKRSLPRGTLTSELKNQDFMEILGIKHLGHRKPDTLSGGERQRSALARALARNPSILLLDEPLSGLDEKRKEEILPYFEKLKVLQLPIIYVSHCQAEISRLATCVVHLTPPLS